MSSTEPECRACRISVRVPEAEVRRILDQMIQTGDVRLADEAQAERRLAICNSCPDLQYGCTCRHCGCLVAVRARLANKSCPASPARWE